MTTIFLLFIIVALAYDDRASLKSKFKRSAPAPSPSAAPVASAMPAETPPTLAELAATLEKPAVPSPETPAAAAPPAPKA